jgi:hypothetical protein
VGLYYIISELLLRSQKYSATCISRELCNKMIADRRNQF